MRVAPALVDMILSPPDCECVELSAFAYIYEMLFESAPDKLVSGTQRQRRSRKKTFPV